MRSRGLAPPDEGPSSAGDRPRSEPHAGPRPPGGPPSRPSPVGIGESGPSGVLRSETKRSKYSVPDMPEASPPDGPSRTSSSEKLLVFRLARDAPATPFTSRSTRPLRPLVHASSSRVGESAIVIHGLVVVPPLRAATTRTWGAFPPRRYWIRNAVDPPAVRPTNTSCTPVDPVVVPFGANVKRARYAVSAAGVPSRT